MKALAMVVAALVFAGCAARSDRPLQVASGTIIVDAGLADSLSAWFLEDSGIRLAVRGVGSGEAFDLAGRGEVDLLWVHEPQGLARLRSEGKVEKLTRMFAIRWVLAGPADDPAGVSAARSFPEMFAQIAHSGSGFVSRGDRSGTHVHELEIWKEAAVVPDQTWYATTGQGQAETLRVASEKGAYALTDEATYDALQTDLRMWTSAEPGEMTVYNAAALKGPRRMEAVRFVEFASRPDIRGRMASFRRGFQSVE